MEHQRLKDFINHEFKEFSNYDNVRSIPKLVDGFKDSQRKCVYGLIKHGNTELKVSQLSEYISMATDYLHGSASLCGTIVGLAQNYPGTNNVNLFEPLGQFGNILSSTPAAARYIYTKPTDYLKKLIRSEDDDILEYRIDEGSKYEPVNYLPLVPLWVLNGARGIGTGHSVNIQPRSLKDIKTIVKNIISGKKRPTQDPLPFYNGWKGTVERSNIEGQYVLTGTYEIVNTTTIKVSELPIGYDIDKYKSILIKLMDDGVVKDFDNNSTEEGFDFVITVPREVTRRSEQDLINLFKLQTKVTENITLWDTEGVLTKYNSIIGALEEVVKYRLEKYIIRKQSMLDKMNKNLKWLNYKLIFVLYWINEMKDPQKKTKDQILKELNDKINIPLEVGDKMLDLRIGSLTKELVDKLKNEIRELEISISDLEKMEIEELYKNELDEVKT